MGITVVVLGGEFQGHLIFIIVVLVVAAKAHKHCQLVVLKVGGILLQGIGMHKHLQTLILAEVEVGVLIHGLGLSLGKLLDDEAESLLVVFNKLWLRRIGNTADTRRKDVVDGELVGMLLDVHIGCLEFPG